jgi:plasmid replication initiation protein
MSRDMSKEEFLDLCKERSYSVVKHNDLIQKSRFDLSLQEQKIILYIISKIKPGDKDFETFEFKIKDFCRVCGIDDDSGKNYSALKEAIKNLADKSVWVALDNGVGTLLRWIDYVTIYKRSGKVTIKINDVMKPYLLQLKKHFTTFDYYYIIAMQGKYSPRLYEILKSYQSLRQCGFDIERFKLLLGVVKYPAFANFKQKVLDPSVSDINTYSDISVAYELEKQGRKYYWIKFTITPKYEIGNGETLKMWKNIDSVVGGVFGTAKK